MRSTATKVSIVTPFFNEERYLGTCIESVLAQSHENFEYLLIDNHSTDGSAEIAREHAAKDERLRVIRPPEHLAQLPNHNFGLAQIADDSDYCKIVQGDDWIYPRCIELLVNRAEEHPSIALVAGYTLLEEKVYLDSLHPSEGFLPGREVSRRFFEEGLFLFGSPTAHLFRADRVRARPNFYVAEADPFADVDACLALLEDADFGFVHQVLSFTRRSNDSVTTRRQRYADTLLLTRYVMSQRHGACCFEADALRACRSKLRAEYYRSLGESVWRLMPSDYWELQQRCLAAAGETLSRPRLLAGAGLALLELLLDPLESLRRIRARLSARGPKG